MEVYRGWSTLLPALWVICSGKGESADREGQLQVSERDCQLKGGQLLASERKCQIKGGQLLASERECQIKKRLKKTAVTSHKLFLT